MSELRSLWRRLARIEIAACAAILAFAFVSPRLIPYNMDEFSHYHVLGCQYNELSAVHHNFSEGCGQYDLKLPGTSIYLPLRSYRYVGVLQTPLFVPFWALFQDPVAGRVQGAAFLIVAIFLLSRLVNVPWRYGLFAVLLFPQFCMPFILDTGNGGILTCILLSMLLLLRRAVASEELRSKAWLGVLVGLLAFAGFQIKPVFVWTFPAVGLWGLWAIYERAGRLSLPAFTREVPLFVSAAIAAAVPAAMLLAAVDRSGVPYLEVASNAGLTAAPSAVAEQFSRLGRIVVDGTLFNFRAIRPPGNLLLDAMPLLIAAVVIGAVLWLKANRDRLFVGILLLLAGVTFVVTATSNNAWAPHHLVLAFVFGIAAVAYGVAALQHRTASAVLFGLSAAYWVSLGARLPQAGIQSDTNFDKDRLTRFIRTSDLDATTVQAHIDWGTYFLSHTFGDKNQIVLNIYGFLDEPSYVERVRAIGTAEKRDILLITREPAVAARNAYVVATLGQPADTYSFDTWTILRYRL
jgi:hypothetical protein